VALGFIKSLVDYIKPNDNDLLEAVVNDQITDSVTVESPVSDVVENEESDNIVEKIRKENVEKYIESLDEAEDITPEENTQEIVENVVQINEDDEKKN
jgi:hypothetical protein